MEFGFTQEQEMIRDQAAEFLKNECPTSFVRELIETEQTHSEGLWEKMASMGWMGLIFPEEYGGEGLSFVELAVILEALGGSLAPGSFFSTVVLAGLTLTDTASAEQKKRWLAPLAAGSLKATLALTEPYGGLGAAGVSAKAEHGDDGYLITGTKLFVPDADIADLIICAARTGGASAPEEGVSLFAVDRKSEGLSVTALKTMDQTRRFCEVAFERVKAPEASLLGEVGRAWHAISRVLSKATIGLCSQMVGGAQKALQMSVEYSKTRIQFGRPIGSFQAIQHRLADMLLLTESARSAVYAAAWAASREREEMALLASIAKAYTSDAYSWITGEAIQIHGGMGFTWEADPHLYFKRAKADEFLFGNANYHREQVARMIGL